MIENMALKCLGIYPECIERADEIVKRVCEEYGIDSDAEIWPYVQQDFEENVFGGDLTNEIMSYMFRNLQAALIESGKLSDEQIDWYVNGYASSFVIDGEYV